jgi:hypothetical protein
VETAEQRKVEKEDLGDGVKRVTLTVSNFSSVLNCASETRN